ncbi:hypothetical protein RUND412_003313 [Rhizina undulata]
MEVDAAPLDINPYTVLSVAPTATASEIRSAYRKLALSTHPDKVAATAREAAHVKFQELAFAYAVLSDEKRRKRYDATGSLKEGGPLDDGDFDWADFFKAQFKDVVSVEAVEKFRKEYQGSEEEKADLLETYTAAKGNMDKIFSTIMLSNPLTDEDRFRVILDEAIANGDVKSFPAYTTEGKSQRKKRHDKAKKEAKEAEEYAKELGVYDKLFGKADAEQDAEEEPNSKGKRGKGKAKKTKKEDDTSALESLIKSRNANRMHDVIANIEAKYGRGGNARGDGKRKKAVDEDVGKEPTEEEFEAARKKLKLGKTEKKEQEPTRRSARNKR